MIEVKTEDWLRYRAAIEAAPSLLDLCVTPYGCVGCMNGVHRQDFRGKEIIRCVETMRPEEFRAFMLAGGKFFVEK